MECTTCGYDLESGICPDCHEKALDDGIEERLEVVRCQHCDEILGWAKEMNPGARISCDECETRAEDAIREEATIDAVGSMRDTLDEICHALTGKHVHELSVADVDRTPGLDELLHCWDAEQAA